jgi:hypothetical protein
VITIARVIGPGVAFSAHELWQHQRVSPPLAAALADLGIITVRQLGKLLKRSGLQRVGRDQAGCIWNLSS